MPPRECRRRSRGQGSSCSFSPPDQDTDSNHAGGACIADRINSIFASPDVHQSWTREHPRLFHKPIVSNFPIVVDVLVAGPGAFVPKGINYRMSPENAVCLVSADTDCCVLANNHIVDW